ncbi:Hexokinase HKDC1 [Oopsacas minuta]|uniref:Phosphotransferase n=1 Tax=Oopsacas minuta TaxID=111878 RepID=A0AAV7K2S2_9METZ|nr:Hexokinase HKDC1 [Oopsacas minuta]
MATSEQNPAKVFLNTFNLTPADLLQISDLFIKEMEEGLSKDDHNSPVKMLVAYVHGLPTGKERGRYLALDLGGSNFRVLLITIEENGSITQLSEKFALYDDIMRTTQEVLFDKVAESVISFGEKYGIKETLPLGFTFSFPVQQHSINKGTLIRWTKGFSAEGAVGRDIMEMLQEALDRKGSKIAYLSALVNDTTGTLMAKAIEEKECFVGLILGTGTNACYLEKISNIPKYKSPPPNATHVLINTEWGAFGENGALDKFLTEMDAELDKAALHKKQQIFEKMISGKYMGELVRLCCQKMISIGILFKGQSTPKFDKIESFESSFVSQIEEGDKPDIKIITGILNQFDITPSEQDCQLVRDACVAVSTRAARLSVAGIIALVKKMNRIEGCTVAIDGTLFKKHPKLSGIMRQTLDEVLPGNKIRIVESEDGSGRGAAITAALASLP